MHPNQTDIFRDDKAQLQYAELCNALYERELSLLAQSGNLSLLQRRLKGLSHHIKRAAAAMLTHQGPLEVDVHNASWQAKQAAQCPANGDQQKTSLWLSQYAYMGMPVAVHICHLGQEHLELDSIDRIEIEKHRLHLNKHGWFNLSGKLQDEDASQLKQLLVPAKNNLLAACCGHSWKHQRKSVPRTLSLRELLLSTQINWKNVKKPL
ncbi:hypothetical protein P2G88_08440 [Aliiglaciecola sp. CAU 1673]|uniref:hypothetical protein n=1 Tax=Aliiglaciecola sp. CAU 1673 TaxID=3032595 RepID=UPI0023DCBA25|nr:hypothetical protein [Aliiglaciecola sp. CAU 1673]MDF2178277.1 hypothetical protein [Aliiglaciecola sp. CAU 1673]